MLGKTIFTYNIIHILDTWSKKTHKLGTCYGKLPDLTTCCNKQYLGTLQYIRHYLGTWHPKTHKLGTLNKIGKPYI